MTQVLRFLGKYENFHSLLWGEKHGTVTGEDNLVCCYKTKHLHFLIQKPQFLVSNPKTLKTYHPYANLHVACMTAKADISWSWKNVQTFYYCCSTLKVKELSVNEKWRHVKGLILNEESEIEKATNCMSSMIWQSKKKPRTIVIVYNPVITRSWG